MSEQIEKVAQRLKFDDVAAYLSAVGITPKCSSCGKETPSILTAEDGTHVRIFGVQEIAQEAIPALRLIPNIIYMSIVTECTSCGYQRHFGIERVYEWLARNKKGL